MSNMKKVFTVQTVDGQSTVVNLNTRVNGEYFMAASGGFGGGTLAAEVSPDGGTTWVPVRERDGTAAVLTTPGELPILVAGDLLRLDLSGATAATLDAWVGR